MYTLPPSTATSLQTMPGLSVDYTISLKPWFTRQILQQGLDILHNEEVSFFSFQRRYAGLISGDTIRATIQMAEGRGPRPFVFRDSICSHCIGRHNNTRCKHTAALALLCLCEINDNLIPLAEPFTDSPWSTIAGYLHDRAALTLLSPQIFSVEDHYLLLAADKTGLELRILLSSEAARELLCLFSVAHGSDQHLQPDPIMAAEIQELQQQLSRLAATPNERVLNEHGSTGKRQHLDRSVWMHLARLLFLHLPDTELEIQHSPEGEYALLSSTEKGAPLFSLTLPRKHTWELLDKLQIQDVPLTPERAEQFSRVIFNTAKDGIKVIRCCRLTTGEEYALADLADNRYGTRFLVDNRLFSLKPIPLEEQLTSQEKGQLSLFTATEPDAVSDRTFFTVPGDTISDFMQKNDFQLHCGRHQVDPAILELNIIDMPDELVIDQYEEDDDWCYLAGWYDLGNRKIRLSELLRAGEDGRDMLPGAIWLRLSGSPLAWFHHLGADRIERDRGGKDTQPRIKLRRGEFIALSSQIGRVRNSKAAAGPLPAFLRQSETTETQAIPELPSHLRSYQRHGAAWLYQLCRFRIGGILADDMGLGKTHQALALIALLAREKGKFLIVCPAAVLYHWPEKQQTFFPDLSMTVHHGPGRSLEQSLKSQVVVTTYGILTRDADLFAHVVFTLIIFDEMHFLKNRKTAAFTTASRLVAGGILGLTGTPVENNIAELATLLGLCLPDLFGIKEFRRQFAAADTMEKRQNLQRLVAPFILRRTRKQVLFDLPQCCEDIRLCTLSPDQVSAYRQVVEQVKAVVDQLAGDEILPDFSPVLTTIIRLKQICNHLCQLEQCTDWQRYKSGKWDEFARLIQQCMEAKLKVVVFSQFTSMLDIIENWLTAEQIDYIQLRGSVGAKERSKRINRFNSSSACRICCASLLAGGTGIDLTGAQVVIHYDRWWNPAREEQATARVHRMGQRHPVQVYKLVTRGTLEEKIHRLIEKKRALAAELVVEDDGSILKIFDRKELAGLFRYSG